MNATAGPLTGTVVAFDATVGLGEIDAADGRRFPFHCIVIADGTRTIATGTAVVFALIPKLGRWEAAQVRPA